MVGVFMKWYKLFPPISLLYYAYIPFSESAESYIYNNLPCWLLCHEVTSHYNVYKF